MTINALFGSVSQSIINNYAPKNLDFGNQTPQGSYLVDVGPANTSIVEGNANGYFEIVQSNNRSFLTISSSGDLADLPDPSYVLKFSTGRTCTINTFSGSSYSSRPTVTATSIDVGNITFSWDQPLETGHFADGQAFVVAPSGLNLNDATPSVTTIEDNGTYTINGAQINPELNSPQSLDERFGSYSAGVAPSFPYSAEVGDCMLKVISRPAFGAGGSVNDTVRKGLAIEQAALYVVDSVPALNAFSPPAVWPTSEKTSRPQYNIDIDALYNQLPSYSTASHTGVLTWDSIAARIKKFAPLNKTGAYLGYETSFPFEFWSSGSFNYGRYNVSGINRACTGLVSDAWSESDKKDALTTLIQHGIQWGETINKSGSIGADGGHYQWHLAPVVLMLYATGQEDRILEFFDRETGSMPGNVTGQVFTIDNVYAQNNLVPHDSLSLAYPWRRREITGVNGNVITTTLRRTGGVSGDGPNPSFANLIMTRESDGATATVVSGGANSPADNEPIDITIDSQPATSFAPGDTIYFESPYDLEAGQHHWRIRTLDNLFNPTHTTAYRGLNFWSGQVLLLEKLGMLDHPIFEATKGYVQWANYDDQPTPSIDFPDHHDSVWEKEMWDDQWTPIAFEFTVSSNTVTNEVQIDWQNQPEDFTVTQTGLGIIVKW